MKTLLPFVFLAAMVTAVSCGTQEVENLRRYSDAVDEQNQQVRKPGSADQTPSGGETSQPTGNTPDSSKPSSPGTAKPSGPSSGKPGGSKPGQNDKPGGNDTPRPTPQVNPTAGDNVPSLRFKTSCYQPGNASCFLHQADSNNSGFYERLCRQGSRDAKVTRGSNACADLKISAKCSANFRGDKLIFYNIGKLTKEKDRELAKTCAGTEVLGQVIKGDYVRFEQPSN